MNCPICKNELRISKKDSRYGLCDHCRKKFRLPEEKTPSRKKDEDTNEHYPKYANIPPKAVRDKREQEMKRAYDELLSIGEEEHKKRFSFFRR